MNVCIKFILKNVNAFYLILALSRQGINAVRRVWGWLRKISTAIVQILHSTEDLGN